MKPDQKFLELLKCAQLERYEALGQMSSDALMRKLDDLNREHQIIEILPREGYVRSLIAKATRRGVGVVLSSDLPGDEDFPGPPPKLWRG